MVSFDSESAVVGGILVHARKLDDVKDLVSVDDFADVGLREIYRALVALDADGAPLDQVAVLERMRVDGTSDHLQSRGGATVALADLAAESTVVENIAYHARIVREGATQRRMVTMLERCRQSLAAGGDIGALLARLGGDVEQLKARALPSPSDMAPPRACEVFRSDAFKAPQRTYPTGLAELDALIAGGVKARQLTVVAAPTGDGKTGLAGTFALHWTKQKQIPVLWCDTEIDNDEQAARLASIDFHLRELRGTPDDFLALRIDPTLGAEALDDLPLYLLNLDDPDGDPFTMIEARAATIKKTHGQPPIIIVDYLQVLAVEDEDQRRVSVTKVATRLRRIARALDTPVIAISSVSRAYYGRNGKKSSSDEEENPRDWLAAAKESGDVEYASAVFIYLDRDPDVDSLGESAARLIVAKSRRGTTGFVGVRFHGPSGAFRAHQGAAQAMAPPSRGSKLEARILAFVRAPSYQPMTPTDLRNLISGGGKQDRDAAIERMLGDGRLRLEEQQRPNAANKLRKVMLVVAGTSPAADSPERRPYAD